MVSNNLRNGPVYEAKMFCANAKVELFLPPLRLCKNLCRIGHIAIRCRSKKDASSVVKI